MDSRALIPSGAAGQGEVQSLNLRCAASTNRYWPHGQPPSLPARRTVWLAQGQGPSLRHAHSGLIRTLSVSLSTCMTARCRAGTLGPDAGAGQESGPISGSES